MRECMSDCVSEWVGKLMNNCVCMWVGRRIRERVGVCGWASKCKGERARQEDSVSKRVSQATSGAASGCVCGCVNE